MQKKVEEKLCWKPENNDAMSFADDNSMRLI